MIGEGTASRRAQTTNEPHSFGRDELNLAEFPLASLSDRVPDGQKTLEYSDIIWDQGRREHVSRKLIITASDKYGLPTAKDDDVILALIQLTAQSKFENQTVRFTRYQIIKQLGWKDTSQNYQRLESSLKRWLGVTLYYDRAWWSKDEDCWVNKSFHILTDLELLDREMRSRKIKAGEGDPRAGQSSFTWSDVVFRSFQAGNLKQIDMKVFRSLKSPIAKRMYRYLDKRFYHRSTLRFELKRFACSHIGLSSKYHTGEIKRRLKAAISELETVGFLVPLIADKRYVKEGKEWFVTFTRCSDKRSSTLPVTTEHPKLVETLTERGISSRQAIRLVGESPHELIRQQVEYLDYLIKIGDKKVSRNPAGYLYRAITEQYAIPTSFETSDQKRAREDKSRRQKKDTERKHKLNKAKELSSARKQKELSDRVWSTLSAEEREKAKLQACKSASELLGRPTTEGPIVETFLKRELLKINNS